MKKEYKKYVSYFQKVVTVGVLTCGKDHEEAEKEARAIMEGDNPIERCFYDETSFELSDSEEWQPDFDIISIDPSKDKHSLEYYIQANDQYTALIAKGCNKKIEEVTNEDFQKFFMDSIQEFIKKGEEKFGKLD